MIPRHSPTSAVQTTSPTHAVVKQKMSMPWVFVFVWRCRRRLASHLFGLLYAFSYRPPQGRMRATSEVFRTHPQCLGTHNLYI